VGGVRLDRLVIAAPLSFPRSRASLTDPRIHQKKQFSSASYRTNTNGLQQ
jgi:hypothetical protein